LHGRILLPVPPAGSPAGVSGDARGARSPHPVPIRLAAMFHTEVVERASRVLPGLATTEPNRWTSGGSLPIVTTVDQLTRLAVAARGGDASALEELVGSTYDQVWRLCAALVGRQRGEDVAQEVYLRAVRALPRFRGESSARTWLLAIARNTCVDELRTSSRRRRRDAAIAAVRTDPSVTPDASGTTEVDDLLSRLEPERRTAFVLTQLLGLAYAEAATICGCSPGTIASRVSRARADLAAFLAEPQQEPHPSRRAASASRPA
jgi:RNA polymerase sigma-70 factor, ECF subfamily